MITGTVQTDLVVHWEKSWENFEKQSVFFPKLSQNDYFFEKN